MVAGPPTQYAVGPSGTEIAYRAAGAGPATVLSLDTLRTVEVMWDEPQHARWLEQLSTFCRHVWFDRRGTGSSGSLPRSEARLLESATDDLLAVLEATGAARAVVLGVGGLSALSALLLAATHPQRVQALVLVEPTARYRADAGYPGLDDAQVAQVLEVLGREWGTGVLSRLLGVSADAVQQQAYARAERLRSTPSEALEAHRALYALDLRELLPSVSVPTQVLARPGHAQAQHVAQQVPGARHVELADRGLRRQVLDALAEVATGQRLPQQADRVLATVLFTDIVGSTAQAAASGDRAWRRRLDEHDALVRRLLVQHRGREVATTGDGFLATFDGPARAIRCAEAVRDGAAALGLEVRVGLHTGEVELRGDDISGLTVHIGARVAAAAGPSEVLVSRTVADLVAGSGIALRDRGEHVLKGVDGQWRLFCVEQEGDRR